MGQLASGDTSSAKTQVVLGAKEVTKEEMKGAKKQVKGKAVEAKELTREERRLKRLSVVQSVEMSPGYIAYRTARERGEAICNQVPQTPDPHDANISKRTWETSVRTWKTALEKFGCVQIH